MGSRSRLSCPEYQQLLPKSTAKSNIWKFFGLPADGSGKINEQNIAICKLCKIPISAKGGSTSNLRSHLKVHHNAQFKSLELDASPMPKKAPVQTIKEESDDDAEYQSQMAMELGTSGSSSSHNLVIEQNFSLQEPETETLIYTSLDDQIDEKCTESITKFLVTSMQSYSLVEEESFKEMVKTLNPWYSLPGCKYFSSTAVPKLHEETAEKLKDILPNSEETHFSLTCDCWSSGTGYSYMATTVHCVNTNWNPISACVNGAYFEKNYAAENLKDFMKGKLEKWGLNLNSIVSCTTNDGATIVGHLNANNIPCFARSINVAANRAVETPRVKKAIRTLISLQNVISHSSEMKKSLGEAQGLPEGNVKNLPSACTTSWWSILKLCIKFLENQEHIVKMMRNFPEKQNLLPEECDIAVLENFVEVASILQDVTENLNSDNYVTSSAVLPLIRQIKKNLKAGENDTDLLCDLKDKILSALSCYDSAPVQKILRFSTFLDPRFRLYFFADDVKESVEEAVINELTDLYKSSDSSMLSVALQSPPRKKRKGLSALLEEVECKDVNNPKQRSSKEVEKYLSMTKIDLDDDPLKWWQEYEQYFAKLSILAKKYLCIQGSSVPLEKVFSARGDVMEKRKRSLSPKNAEKQIFLAYNKKFLDI